MKKVSEHYVNNKEFSLAVMDYVKAVNEAKESDKDIPRITEYIGRCFINIANGLSRKKNFIDYSYRDEMVNDAIENCIKAIMNYKIDKATRTGLPNAFSYFTQICFFAFLRRIAKEKRQHDIRTRYINHMGIDSFMVDDSGTGVAVLESMKNRRDSFLTDNEDSNFN